MQSALVLLAAGMGSRYGGLKQIEPIGPSGETLMDFSIYDALRAGFDKLVFVIRRDIERPFKEIIGRRYEDRVQVEYVFQELNKVPPGCAVPAQRQKPWGTGHAVLVTAEVIDGPFAVINADDFYGRHSFQTLADHLRADTADYAMVGFTLRNTLSDFGTVARGVCRVATNGYLESVVELTKIERNGAGARFTDGDGHVHALTGAEMVSLNMWGFGPSVFDSLRSEFGAFLQTQGQNEKSEFFIPTVANAMVHSGVARLKVLPTPDSWYGITYREDQPRVVEGIGRLIAQGDYPAKLWG